MSNSVDVVFADPWYAVEAKEREALVEELKREIPPEHELFGRPIKALARRHDRDDVLFQVENTPKPYAVVRLTWTVEKKTPGNGPKTEYYDSIVQFSEKMRRNLDVKKSDRRLAILLIGCVLLVVFVSIKFPFNAHRILGGILFATIFLGMASGAFWTAIDAIRTGVTYFNSMYATGRPAKVERNKNPLNFWLLVLIYLSVGMFGLYAMMLFLFKISHS